MERKDALNAKSGISQELLKEIAAQYAVLDSAIRLINQHRQQPNKKQQSEPSFGEWVYNMDMLDKWIHEYTKRRRLFCPKCKSVTTFKCETCDEVYEYHDEL